MNENGLVVIQDMLLRPDQLPPRLRMKFEDCERRGKNKLVGREDECFTVNEHGYVLIGDMWLHPDQLPSGLREKFEDCEKRGKNKVKGEDQCFTVDENGLIQIGDMWLRPEQLPAGLRMKFEDCARRGKNEVKGDTPSTPPPKKNFWPDYVWRKGGHRAGGKQPASNRKVNFTSVQFMTKT